MQDLFNMFEGGMQKEFFQNKSINLQETFMFEHDVKDVKPIEKQEIDDREKSDMSLYKIMN